MPGSTHLTDHFTTFLPPAAPPWDHLLQTPTSFTPSASSSSSPVYSRLLPGSALNRLLPWSGPAGSRRLRALPKSRREGDDSCEGTTPSPPSPHALRGHHAAVLHVGVSAAHTTAFCTNEETDVSPLRLAIQEGLEEFNDHMNTPVLGLRVGVQRPHEHARAGIEGIISTTT